MVNNGSAEECPGANASFRFLLVWMVVALPVYFVSAFVHGNNVACGPNVLVGTAVDKQQISPQAGRDPAAVGDVEGSRRGGCCRGVGKQPIVPSGR